MEELNFLEERHVQTIRDMGDDPAQWLPESQIEHFQNVLASFIAGQPPGIRERYAEEPRHLAERMREAAMQSYSRYEQLPRYSELLAAKKEVEESYAIVRRRLYMPRKLPYFAGTIHRGLPWPQTETVRIPHDPICRELILIEGGLFAYFSTVSQAFCHLLGGEPFDPERWLGSFMARDLDAVLERLHPEHPSVKICLSALETYDQIHWLSTTPNLALSDDFHRVHASLTYGPMIQFVFAHEFGHLGGHLHPGSHDIPQREKEYESDVLALNILGESMRRMSLPLAFSMWPAWIALAALRALRVTHSSDDEPPSETHPTFFERANRLFEALTRGGELKPEHGSAMAEAQVFGELAFRWTSAILDLAHEGRRTALPTT